MTPSTRLAQLSQLAKEKKQATILIYNNPDPDALASAWALKEIFQSFKLNASIRYTGQVGRLQNKALIEALRLPATTLPPGGLEQSDLIALVDAQPSFFKDFSLPHCDVVIDHHPGKVDANVRFVDLRPKCLAASSILTEYLLNLKIRVSKRLATALYYGIETDRRGKTQEPSEVDRRALKYLEKRADQNLIRRIESSHYSLNDMDYFSIALIKQRYANHVLYAHLGPVPYTDICVQVADFLIRVLEAHWALVSAVVGSKLIIVFRCDGYKKHVGKLAQQAFGSLGSAGGHSTMARAEMLKSNLPKGINLTQNETLEWFIINTLAKSDRAFKPLLKVLKNEGIAEVSKQIPS